jgi:hypothetical protein
VRQFLVLARIRVCVHPQCEATEDGEAVRSSSEAQAVNAGENSRRVSVARALPSPNIDENAMLVLSPALGLPVQTCSHANSLPQLPLRFTTTRHHVSCQQMRCVFRLARY